MLKEGDRVSWESEGKMNGSHEGHLRGMSLIKDSTHP